MKVTDFNGITGEKVEREASPEEIAEIEALQVIAENEAIVIAQKAQDKEALLERLGITKEEAALLLS